MKRAESTAKSKGYGPATIVAITVAALVAALAFFLTAGPRVSPCEQATLLEEARMQAAALEAYGRAEQEGRSCSAGRRGAVERSLVEADGAFAEAGVQANRKHRIAAIDGYVTGLELDPTEAGALIALGGQLAVPDSEQPANPIPEENRCEWADRLTAAGTPSAAGAVLAADPDAGKAVCEGRLAKLSAAYEAASDELFRAEELREAGDDSSARGAYAAALGINTGLGAAETGLEGLLGDESRADEVASWLEGVPGSLETALKWGIPLLVALLVVAVLVWMGLRTLAVVSSRARRTLEFVGDHTGLSLLRKVAQPELSVDVFEGGDSKEVGRAFSTLLTQALPLKTGKEAEFPFDRVAVGSTEDQLAADEIGALAKDIPQAKLLGAVLQYAARFFRRRTIKVKGHLIPAAGNRGVGIALSIEGNGMRSECRRTIWGEEFDPKPGGDGDVRWLRLVPAATVWARWQLRREMEAEEELDSEGWLADALFQSGVQWQARSDLDRAEALYAGALEQDPGLLPALHNLAAVGIHRGRYSQAIERLNRLGRELRNPKIAARWPTLSTAHLYTRTLALAYEAKANGNGDSIMLDRARTTGETLVRTLATEIIARDPSRARKSPGQEELERIHSPRDHADEILTELLDAEGPAIVLLAGITVRSRPDLAHAAVGCGEHAPISRLDLSTRTGPEPCDLINRYLLTRKNLSRRSRYNLACYHTTLAELIGGEAVAGCFENALDALDLALEGGELVEWSRLDPSLALLRDRRKAEFDKVLSNHEVQPHTDKTSKTGAGASKDQPRRKVSFGLLVERE